MPVKLVQILIRAYQAIPRLRMCRFSPTCSEYAYQSIGKYGIVRGSLMAIKRLSRCHPFNKK